MSLTEGLNNEEKSAIEQLRSRFKNVTLTPKLKEDSTLFYRFLEVQDFDVDKAENQLLKHINWRKLHQADDILEYFEPREYCLKYGFAAVIGSDKEGDVITYFAPSKLDASVISNCDTWSNNYKSYVWYFERTMTMLKERSAKANKEHMRLFCIFDIGEMTLSTAVSKSHADLCTRLIYLSIDHYPGTCKVMHVINAPSYFELLFPILKTVVSSTVIQKVHVWGKTGWQEALLDAIDAEVLPAFLGGTRTDPDGNPLCHTVVRHPETISPEYYLSDEDRYFKDMCGVKCALIPPSDKTEIFIDIAEEGSLIQWEFFVKENDIGFGLSIQSNGVNEDDTQNIIIPLERYCTPDGNEKGFYKSRSIGTYIIIFDNTYSWMTSKDVLYRVKASKVE